MVRLSATLLAACALAGPALARDFLTGPDLMRICTSPKTGEETACNTYIAGALDEVGFNPGKDGVCKPEGVSLRDLRAALSKWGDAHRDQVKDSASAVLNGMVKANYPCK